MPVSLRRPVALRHVLRLAGLTLLAATLAACSDRVPTAAPVVPAAAASLAAVQPIQARSAFNASPALVVSPASITVRQGRAYPLGAAIVDPLNSVQANAVITWSSSNPAVATVSAAGVVQGVTTGAATITASALNGQFTATSAVTVVAPPVCNAPTVLPPGQSSAILPVPMGLEGRPHVFRLQLAGNVDPCAVYSFRFTSIPTSGVLYQVAEDGTPRLDAPIGVGRRITNSEGFVAYYPAANFEGTDFFRWRVDNENGVPIDFERSSPIHIQSVNDVPTVIPTVNTGQNNIAMSNLLVRVSDVDNLPSSLSTCIVSLPKSGDLYWDLVAPQNKIAVGDCRSTFNIKYVSRVDGVATCGSPPPKSRYPFVDTYRVVATDGRAVSDTVTDQVRILYINTPPIYIGTNQASGVEDASTFITFRAIDVDNHQVRLVVLADPPNGAFYFNSQFNGRLRLTTPFSVNIDPVSGGVVEYVPNPNFNTVSQTESFPFELRDIDPSRCARTMRLTIAPVNDAPVITGPTRTTAVVNLDGTGAPTTINLAVGDDARPADLLAVTLRAQGPSADRLDLINASGLTVTRVNTKEVQFTGTLAQINAVLQAGVNWTPNNDAAAYGELAVIVNDNGNHGTGGALTGTRVVPVDVAFESSGIEGRANRPPADTGSTDATAARTDASAPAHSASNRRRSDAAAVASPLAASARDNSSRHHARR